MVGFQGKILQAMSPLSCLWEGLEDVLKASRSFLLAIFFLSPFWYHIPVDLKT